MELSLQGQKAELRRQTKLRLRDISPEQRRADSNAACALLRTQAAWLGAGAVLFYAPLPQEIDLWPLLQEALQQGKTVALPQFDRMANRYKACQIKDLETDLRIGLYGIREPKNSCAPLPLNRLDFVLAPGVAFDLHGRRLGRGKGYYDQLLAAVRGKTCGVAFDEQVLNEIPVEPHDSDVNCILTPTRWIEL